MRPYVDWCTVEEIQFGIDLWVGRRGIKIELALFKFILLVGLFNGGLPYETT